MPTDFFLRLYSSTNMDCSISERVERLPLTTDGIESRIDWSIKTFGVAFSTSGWLIVSIMVSYCPCAPIGR